jgi:hypothetical protein
VPVADHGGTRISRETWRLLATVLLSVAALWILARIRFPERPPTPNPVAPLLTQIAPRIAFEDLERTLFEIEPQLMPALAVVANETRGAQAGGVLMADAYAAIRVTSGAVALLTEGSSVSVGGARFAGRDRATGLTVLRQAAEDGAPPRLWTPQQEGYPRFVLATELSHGRLSLRPVFLGPLRSQFSSRWSAEVWALPAHAAVESGTFLFTTTGALLGVAARSPAAAVIVPAAVLFSHAQRLLAERPRDPGWLGIEVQPLTADLRSASGLGSGVVVTWVSPKGPAAGKVVPTDVVQAMAGEGVVGASDWEAQLSRVAAGASVVLGISRGGRRLEVAVTAGAPPPTPAAATARSLGIRLRRKPAVGAEVVGVEEGSVGMRAGLRVGDVLTRVGELEAPTPRQVTQAISASPDTGLLAAVARGDSHLVVALGRP